MTRILCATSVLFQIMKFDLGSGKRTTLTSNEFTENLKTVLGKENNRKEATMDDFKVALQHI